MKELSLQDLKLKKSFLTKQLLVIKQKIKEVDIEISNFKFDKNILIQKGFVFITGFEDKYMINDEGDVYNIQKGIKLKPYKNNKGYYLVGLYKNNVRKNYLVHRLVACQFLPNPNDLPEINHKDRNKGNNNVSNLEWCTRSENMIHCCKYGFYNGQKKCKAIVQYDKNYTLIKIWESIKEASIKYNTSISNIVKCCKGKYKTCKGYIWRYDN